MAIVTTFNAKHEATVLANNLNDVKKATSKLRKNLKNLIKNGMSKKTSIAAINWGTYSKQKTVVGDFNNIHEKIKSNNINSPSIIVIGEICKLRAKLN